MNQLLYHINYVNAPVVRQKIDERLVLESIFNKVWNPVFTVGVISFVLSMTLRGFFDQHFAVIPLGLSTLVLLAGIWKLSASATIIFDKKESNVYFIYKHLGYLQKIYVHSLTSFEKVVVQGSRHRKYSVYMLKDDGNRIVIAQKRDLNLLNECASAVASFLEIPLES